MVSNGTSESIETGKVTVFCHDLFMERGWRVDGPTEITVTFEPCLPHGRVALIAYDLESQAVALLGTSCTSDGINTVDFKRLVDKEFPGVRYSDLQLALVSVENVPEEHVESCVDELESEGFPASRIQIARTTGTEITFDSGKAELYIPQWYGWENLKMASKTAAGDGSLVQELVDLKNFALWPLSGAERAVVGWAAGLRLLESLREEAERHGPSIFGGGGEVNDQLALDITRALDLGFTKFRVVRPLGWGLHGLALLAEPLDHSGGSLSGNEDRAAQVVLKVGYPNPPGTDFDAEGDSYAQAAEIVALERLKQRGIVFVPQLQKVFRIRNPWEPEQSALVQVREYREGLPLKQFIVQALREPEGDRQVIDAALAVVQISKTLQQCGITGLDLFDDDVVVHSQGKDNLQVSLVDLTGARIEGSAQAFARFGLESHPAVSEVGSMLKARMPIEARDIADILQFAIEKASKTIKAGISEIAVDLYEFAQELDSNKSSFERLEQKLLELRKQCS